MRRQHEMNGCVYKPMVVIIPVYHSTLTLTIHEMVSASNKYVRILPNGNIPRILCEICSQSHDGKFGSGRFCSLKCSRAVGGKAKRNYTSRNRSNTKPTKTSSSQPQFSVDNPMSWKSDSVVLHRLNQNKSSTNDLVRRRTSPH